MYLHKKYKNLLLDFDDNIKLPARFYEYVEKIKESHKIIFKNKNKYQCSLCNSIFDLKGKIKANEYHRCPNCKRNLVVKSSKLRKFNQKDQFAILEKFQGFFILRAFEVSTFYNCGSYYSHTCEYARHIYDENFNNEVEAYNDNISATISGKYINHRYFLNNNWKENGSYYHNLGYFYKIYPHNLKKVLKNTKWQYCQIWKFAKHVDYFSIEDYLKCSHNNLELLVKNGLYRLTEDLIRQLSYYAIHLNVPFLKQNLDYIKKKKFNVSELKIFEFIREKNTHLIRKYSKYDIDYKTLEKYKIDLIKADKLIPNLKQNLNEYFDYLKFAEELGYNLKDKKVLYPGNLLKAHNELYKLVEVKNNEEIDKKIFSRYKDLLKNKYKNQKYIIFPAKDINSLIDESIQQNNCVKTYAERIANKECDIYFMRLLKNQKKSLVTVEVKNNVVVQQRTKNNMDTTKEQKSFLRKFEKNLVGDV